MPPAVILALFRAQEASIFPLGLIFQNSCPTQPDISSPPQDTGYSFQKLGGKILRWPHWEGELGSLLLSSNLVPSAMGGRLCPGLTPDFTWPLALALPPTSHHPGDLSLSDRFTVGWPPGESSQSPAPGFGPSSS